MKTLLLLLASLIVPHGLPGLISRVQADPHVFIRSVLGYDGSEGRSAPWSRQREICRSVVRYPTTLVPSGNSVGKSWIAARLALWGATVFGENVVFTSAPTQYQLESILWKEIADAHAKSRIPLGGRIGGSPIKYEVSDKQYAVGHVSNQVERMSGHHSGRLFAIIDEASGVGEQIYEAVDSLNPWRKLLIGNPLRSEGRFYELCRKASESPSELVNLIRVPSLDSPDIALERSPRGMADQGFLRSMRFEYGEESLWWRTHILAQFPSESDHVLIPDEWLVYASLAIPKPGGRTRLGIDIALGNLGDESVVCTRDDNRLIDVEASNAWTLDALAQVARNKADLFHARPEDVVYDASGVGADFGNRLDQVGLREAKPYLGARSGPKFANLRTAAAWAARRRLDPNHVPEPGLGKIAVPQTPFSIPPKYATRLRDEIRHIRVELDDLGRPCLEPKELLREKLKRSPDWSDALFMTFAYP